MIHVVDNHDDPSKPWVIDPDNLDRNKPVLPDKIIYRGVEIHLPPTEARILDILRRNQGEYVSAKELIGKLWHHTPTRLLKDRLAVYLYYLRSRCPGMIENERGVGWRVPKWKEAALKTIT